MVGTSEVAANPSKIPLGPLARRLVSENLLSEQAAYQALRDAQTAGTAFVRHLLDHRLIDSGVLAHEVASEFGMPLVDIDTIDIDLEVVKLVNESLITQHGVLPIFRRGNRIFVAMADPTNLRAMDEIKFQLGSVPTEAVVVDGLKLARMIERSLDATVTSLSELAGLDEATEGLLDQLEATDRKSVV